MIVNHPALPDDSGAHEPAPRSLRWDYHYGKTYCSNPEHQVLRNIFQPRQQ